jgi:nucleotide-binding universal stress UspA family protein
VGRFEKILFCTDFSENADYAFDFAVDSAVRRPGCTLYLLHVIPEIDAQFWKTYVYEVDNVDQKAKNDIDEKIDRVYRPRVPAGVEFKVEIRVGKDAQMILEFAEQTGIDLIVMGRRGHSALQRALFGNVTELVARKAHCAMLIIPLDVQKKQVC